MSQQDITECMVVVSMAGHRPKLANVHWGIKIPLTATLHPHFQVLHPLPSNPSPGPSNLALPEPAWQKHHLHFCYRPLHSQLLFHSCPRQDKLDVSLLFKDATWFASRTFKNLTGFSIQNELPFCYKNCQTFGFLLCILSFIISLNLYQSLSLQHGCHVHFLPT